MSKHDYSGDPIDGTISHLLDDDTMQARKEANGETVSATTDDDMHTMETTHIPSEVDLEELTEKQAEIVEIAAHNPTLTTTEVNERSAASDGYANKVLKDKCPEWYETVFKAKTPDSKQKGQGYSASDDDGNETVTSADRIEYVRESNGEAEELSEEGFAEMVGELESISAQAKLNRIRQTCETVAHMDTPVGEFADGLLEVIEE